VHAILELSRLGFELRRPMADFLRDGIYELRVKVKRVHYRMLYFFHGRNVVVLSHGCTKEGAVPKVEIERAATNKSLVEKDDEKYTAECELT
jgi:phage-related protein